MIRRFQMCTRCVMDTFDPDIRFDARGVCNHCREHDYKVKVKLPPPESREVQYIFLDDYV